MSFIMICFQSRCHNDLLKVPISKGDDCDGDHENDGNNDVDHDDKDIYQGGGHEGECGHLDGAKE